MTGATAPRSRFRGLPSTLLHRLDSRGRARQSAAMPDASKKTGDADALRKHGGFADLVGYELTHWEDDLAEVALTVGERHLNRSGVLHGGVLTTLIDTACGYCGCYTAEGETPRRAFTLSLTTSFIGAGQAGQRLVARATRSGGGRSVFFADCTVSDAEGRVVGTGQGTFKYITLRSQAGAPPLQPNSANRT